MEYPIITKGLCRSNRIVRSIQKETKKVYKISRRDLRISKREMSVRAKINKVVTLKVEGSFVDLTKEQFNSNKTNKENSNQTVVSLYQTMNTNELLAKLEKLQIKGLSGGGFKTADKIRTLMESGVQDKCLIINAVECEPGLVHDEWLLYNQLHIIQKGIKILMQSIPFNKVYIASKNISDTEQDGMKKGLPSQAKIITVPYYYPMGEEHNLIQYIMRKQMNKKEIPARKGILVVNVQTIYAIAKAMAEDRIQESRYLTVANLVEGKAMVVRAYMGMKVCEVANKVLGASNGLSLYCGGGADRKSVV